MKKSILYLMILGIFVACDNNNVINNNYNDSTKDTTSNSNVKIDPNECYMLQEFNESGEPVESYICIVFEKNAGRTYEDAFNSIKSDLDALVNRNISEEKDGGNYDTSLWEVRQIIRNVKNSPDEKLVYTSIELYMFSIVYNSYTIVHQYCVIDSEGNLYQIVSQID